jgi:phage host-nuclease inhibitor protein Gam
MNIDIDTHQAKPGLTITSDKHLSDIIFDLASKQLLINAAETDMQARVEAAKKAFADATAPISSEITTLFAAVEAYANEHKDRLFPLKGAKRKKTFSVLQHALQYRSSDQVKAPANAVLIIKTMIFNLEVEIQQLGQCEESTRKARIIQLLEGIIRQPDPELNKDAVKALADKELVDHLAAHGIKVETVETFKLAFAFTPEQEGKS